MIPDLNTIAEQHSNPTQKTEAAITQFLDHAATNPSTIVQYKSSNMILHIDGDASYLSEPWSCSRTVVHYYLSLLRADPEKASNLPPPANGRIHTEWRILKHVVASAAEVEVRGLFQKGRTAVLLRTTVHEFGPPNHQPQSKQITPRPKASSLLRLDKKSSNSNRNGTTSVSHDTDKGWIYYLLNGGFPSTSKQNSY